MRCHMDLVPDLAVSTKFIFAPTENFYKKYLGPDGSSSDKLKLITYILLESVKLFLFIASFTLFFPMRCRSRNEEQTCTSITKSFR